MRTRRGSRAAVAVVLAGSALAACTSGSAAEPELANTAGTVAQAPERPPLLVTAYGATGNDDTDDTAALQRAMDSLRPGDTLLLPPGTYRHSKVLTARVPDVRIDGTDAQLLATHEESSAFHIAADRVEVDDLTLSTEATTRRWDAYDQMKVRVSGHTGVVLRGITVLGSAASGIYVGDGATDFRIERPIVRDTQADGIHMTGGVSGGVVIEPLTERTGDDGVAVVSYDRDRAVCKDITITAPRVLGTRWGRGISVVGGRNITYTDIDVRDTNAAAVYVGVEGEPYNTAAVAGVRIAGGTVTGANQNATIDHGAVVVYLGRAGFPVSDVELSDLAISATRATAASTVTVLSTYELPTALRFTRVSITGGPKAQYGGNVGPNSYTVS